MGLSLQLSMCVLFWGFLGLFVPAVEGIGRPSHRNTISTDLFVSPVVIAVI